MLADIDGPTRVRPPAPRCARPRPHRDARRQSKITFAGSARISSAPGPESIALPIHRREISPAHSRAMLHEPSAGISCADRASCRILDDAAGFSVIELGPIHPTLPIHLKYPNRLPRRATNPCGQPLIFIHRNRAASTHRSDVAMPSSQSLSPSSASPEQVGMSSHGTGPRRSAPQAALRRCRPLLRHTACWSIAAAKSCTARRRALPIWSAKPPSRTTQSSASIR